MCRIKVAALLLPFETASWEPSAGLTTMAVVPPMRLRRLYLRYVAAAHFRDARRAHRAHRNLEFSAQDIEHPFDSFPTKGGEPPTRMDARCRPHRHRARVP
jgi:hypothetical protein